MKPYKDLFNGYRLFILAAFAALGHTPISYAAESTATKDSSAEAVFDRSTQVGLVDHWGASAKLDIKQSNRILEREGQVLNLKPAQQRDSMRLFRFDKPVDVSGISFLLHENSNANDDIWMYLPGANKTRRILSSSMHDSFMASDFSYSDLMAPKTSNFKHEFIDNANCNTNASSPQECYAVKSTVVTPKIGDSLGFYSMNTFINKADFLSYRIEYFDEKGTKIKFQDISGFVKDNHSSNWIASARIMTNIKKSSVSQLNMSNITFDDAYDVAQFSESKLGRP